MLGIASLPACAESKPQQVMGEHSRLGLDFQLSGVQRVPRAPKRLCFLEGALAVLEPWRDCSAHLSHWDWEGQCDVTKVCCVANLE